MKTGDLVTVLPYGKGIYLVVEDVRSESDQMWWLYDPGDDRSDGRCFLMREKWIEVINECN